MHKLITNHKMTNCLFLSGEGVLKCRCSPCHPNAVNDTCIAKFQCFTGLRLVVENGEQVEIISKGCMSEEENSILQVTKLISQCSNMIRNISCISSFVFLEYIKFKHFAHSDIYLLKILNLLYVILKSD